MHMASKKQKQTVILTFLCIWNTIPFHLYLSKLVITLESPLKAASPRKLSLGLKLWVLSNTLGHLAVLT